MKEKKQAIETIKGNNRFFVVVSFTIVQSMSLANSSVLQDPYRLKGAGVKGTTKSSETGSCSETAKDGERQENKREQRRPSNHKEEEGRQCTSLVIRCNRR